MARLVVRSRKVLIGMAFIGVMVASGGFLGTLAGVVLALLARSVLDINTGTGEFIAAWLVAGCLAALLLGIYMTMRELGYQIGGAKVTNAATAPAPVTDSN